MDVITIRHPDWANETKVFGGSHIVIDIDLGRADLSNAWEWKEWCDSLRADANCCTTTEGARFVVHAVVNAAEEFGHPPPDWCSLERYQ